MPGHPMPVAPVYQPELAADAVHWAAQHRRREVYVGVPTVYTILGNKIAPWVAERYLAKTAIDGQQTEGEPDEQNRDGNLFEAPGGDAGAHGGFDDQSKTSSLQLLLTRHRRALGAAAVA